MDQQDFSFPDSKPYRTDILPVGQGHSLYFEESGNPAGRPVVFLHGGPGSGCQPAHRRLFDPALFRLLLFDQRGAGRSTSFRGQAFLDSPRVAVLALPGGARHSAVMGVK